MSLFIINDYNVYLDIPDDINFSFNYMSAFDIFNMDKFIDNLFIKDEDSLIILWGCGYQIPVIDQRITKLNDFYQSIKNPMILFNGGIFKERLINFPTLEFSMFQHISKMGQKHDRAFIPNKTKKFLYSSTKDYVTRRYIIQLLLNEYADQGYLAYKCHVKDFKDADNFSHDILNSCNSIKNLLPIEGFDTIVDYMAVPESVINDSYLSIITETYHSGALHISEKVFNAMMYNHFFIYLGPPGTLTYLRELGFKTFSHIIDESYDDIENIESRLMAVSTAIKDFLNQPLDQIEKIYQDNQNIFEHNRKLVQSTDINDIVIPQLRRAIDVKS